ncbi:hypothetical protein GCM10028804_52490 [Larkinella terrae]
MRNTEDLFFLKYFVKGGFDKKPFRVILPKEGRGIYSALPVIVVNFAVSVAELVKPSIEQIISGFFVIVFQTTDVNDYGQR